MFGAPRRRSLADLYNLPSEWGRNVMTAAPAAANPDDAKLDALLTVMANRNQPQQQPQQQQPPPRVAPQAMQPPPALQPQPVPPPPPPPQQQQQEEPPPLDVLHGAQLPEVHQTYGDGVGFGQALGRAEAQTPDFSKPRGIFGRIGEALRDPETKGTLLRNGYAMLTGQNPMSGFTWLENKRQQEEANRRWQQGFGLQQRDADRQDFQANSTARHYDRSDDNQSYGNVTNRMVGMGGVSNDANRNVVADNSSKRDVWGRIQTAGIGANASMYGSDKDYAGRVYSSDSSADASKYGDRARLYGVLNDPSNRNGKPDPSQFREVETEMPGHPAQNGWLSDTPAVPKITSKTYFPKPPQGAIDAARQKGPKMKAEFERLFGPGSWAEARLGD